MLLNAVTLSLVIIQIICTQGHQEKFVIENKKTGDVIEEIEGHHEVVEWGDTETQLFTLELQNNSTYIIRNIATKNYIQCTINGSACYKWKLSTQNYTRIEFNNPSIFLNNDGKILRCFNTKQNDESDIWIFIERSKKINMKFTIENKKTGEVLEEANEILKMGKWEDKDSQLWTIRPKNQSGYSIVNVASGTILTSSKNGTENWKLHTRGETWIQTEHPNVFLADKSGKPVYVEYKQKDDSDRWSLVERKYEKNNKLKRVYVEGHQEKFVIENKKTGAVLEEAGNILEMNMWENRDSQLWSLKPRVNGYSIVNVASGSPLAYLKNGREYEVWNLKTSNDTWIQIDNANVFLAHKDGKPVFIRYKQDDDSDRWLLAPRELEKNSRKPKRIYVEDYQEKFVIENKKTGMVLDVPRQFLEIDEWENKASQLWTLEPQNKSGHFIIRNVANRGVLTYDSGTDHQIWKLNTHGATLIEVEGANVFLADSYGDAVFTKNKQNDESDRWLLVEEKSKRINTKPKSIYAESQRYIQSE